MCLYPRLYKNPKYLPNKKNGGVIPIVPDERVLLVPVGCKDCIECRKQRADGWKVRLFEEHRKGRKGVFVSLTFDQKSITKLRWKIKKQFGNVEGYDLDRLICTKAVEYFRENWRKQNDGEKVDYFLVTELGHIGTEHVHMHGIIWDNDWNKIKKAWKRGWVYFGS